MVFGLFTDTIEAGLTKDEPTLEEGEMIAEPIETAPKDGSNIALFSEGRWLSPCSWSGHAISEDGPFWIWWVPGPEWLLEVKSPTHWLNLKGRRRQDSTRGR